jgi:hypothetical protein
MPTLDIALYRQDLAPLKLELGPIIAAEHRINDIGFATKDQAKVLYSTFIGAYIHAAKMHAMVKLHVAKGAIESRKRRSIVLIDIIPGKAKEKGLGSARSPTGAEDVREAFFYADEEFVAIENSRSHLEAAEALMFGKMMAFKSAAEACAAMLSPDERPRASNTEVVGGFHGVDPNGRMVEAGAQEHTPAAPPPIKDVAGFGSPVHNTSNR